MTDVILAILFTGLTPLTIGLLLHAIRHRASAAVTWRRLGEDQRRLLAIGSSVVQAPPHILDEYWGSECPPRREVLMLRLAQIEAEANKVLDARLGPKCRQLFEIRSELRRLRIWSDGDVATFDRAMRIRNSMVHSGDRISSSESDGVTNKSLSPLLAKLTQASPPFSHTGGLLICGVDWHSRRSS